MPVHASTIEHIKRGDVIRFRFKTPSDIANSDMKGFNVSLKESCKAIEQFRTSASTTTPWCIIWPGAGGTTISTGLKIDSWSRPCFFSLKLSLSIPGNGTLFPLPERKTRFTDRGLSSPGLAIFALVLSWSECQLVLAIAAPASIRASSGVVRKISAIRQITQSSLFNSNLLVSFILLTLSAFCPNFCSDLSRTIDEEPARFNETTIQKLDKRLG